MNYKFYALAAVYGFQSYFSFERVIAWRNSWIKNKVCDRLTGNLYLYLYLNTCTKHIPETTAEWPPSDLSSPFESSGNKNSSKDSSQPSSPLLSSPFLHDCVMKMTLFFLILFLFYVARSMSSKDTCFVVTCKNKARVISLLYILLSISGLARSLPRGWESTQID